MKGSRKREPLKQNKCIWSTVCIECLHLTFRLNSQEASSVSTVPGESKASWPCHALLATTPWKTLTWSSPIPTSCPLTWTSCSLSSWSWRRTGCGTPSATKRPSATSGSAWTSRISAPRASSSSPSTAVAPTTSPSWWSNSKARPVSTR